MSGFFIAINVMFALVFLGVMKLGKAALPDMMESWWLTLPLGFIALGATLWVAYKAHQFIERRPFRGRGHGPD